MSTWFEAKVKYMKTNAEGRAAKVTEGYLLDAVTYTEAEARVVREMESVISGEYYLTSLKKSNITEIVSSQDETDDRWYKAKVCFMDADEVSGKEKSSPIYFLVAAHNMDSALEHLKDNLASYSVDWEICSLSDTNFMDVYPYEAPVVPQEAVSEADVQTDTVNGEPFS